VGEEVTVIEFMSELMRLWKRACHFGPRNLAAEEVITGATFAPAVTSSRATSALLYGVAGDPSMALLGTVQQPFGLNPPPLHMLHLYQ